VQAFDLLPGLFRMLHVHALLRCIRQSACSWLLFIVEATKLRRLSPCGILRFVLESRSFLSFLDMTPTKSPCSLGFLPAKEAVLTLGDKEPSRPFEVFVPVTA
jgi:hypothetical protein